MAIDVGGASLLVHPCIDSLAGETPTSDGIHEINIVWLSVFDDAIDGASNNLENISLPISTLDKPLDEMVLV